MKWTNEKTPGGYVTVPTAYAGPWSAQIDDPVCANKKTCYQIWIRGHRGSALVTAGDSTLDDAKKTAEFWLGALANRSSAMRIITSTIGMRVRTSRYEELIAGVDLWPSPDELGHSVVPIDAFKVLCATEAPQDVIDAFMGAFSSGANVRFESHSCALGSCTYVSAIGPMTDHVRALFDDLDARKLRDGRVVAVHDKRWSEGDRFSDGQPRWRWTIDDY